MTKVLVTGASGQLGRCFQKLEKQFPQLEFTFAGSAEFDVTMFGLTGVYFRKNQFDYCINCAAYTQVEKAETDREMAYLINAGAVKNLAEICKAHQTTLIHFSTDYVFDGRKKEPYSEEDQTNPLNVYGASKLTGEDCVQEIMDNYFIFRTSWLYSEFGNNFYNTIRKRAKKGEIFKITGSQKGTPTNANDLALFVLQLIAAKEENYGLYHYSNLGEATWYDFAKEILKLSGKLEEVELIEDNDYKTMALRPENSVLSKEKVLKAFQPKILSWQESLAKLCSGI
ncbi:MAG TPA: dTDP-4-dehydrorhamnose reductase [Salinimicrobium sp.]|nr:dTDP-4-dehydrorhamnose reductase [Salinimicrobium sp.]